MTARCGSQHRHPLAASGDAAVPSDRRYRRPRSAWQQSSWPQPTQSALSFTLIDPNHIILIGRVAGRGAGGPFSQFVLS
jgi:hypothetical protein